MKLGKKFLEIQRFVVSMILMNGLIHIINEILKNYTFDYDEGKTYSSRSDGNIIIDLLTVPQKIVFNSDFMQTF